ncbi:MAG: response regulator [Gammaproteobacteria bacterium]
MPNDFRILFVDNSRTTRAAMSRLFEEKGFEVTTTGTGSEAIEMVSTGAFQLVVMDLYMPLMNGYEAAKIIRSLPGTYNQIPIIALTASNDPKDMDIAKEAGMNEFVIKTQEYKDLFEIIQQYQSKN